MSIRRRPIKFIVALLIVFSQFIFGNSLLSAHGSSSPLSASADTPLPDSFYTLNPIADTTIRQDLPNNNYGSITTIQTDNSPIKHILLKFNVTGISGRQIIKA